MYIRKQPETHELHEIVSHASASNNNLDNPLYQYIEKHILKNYSPYYTPSRSESAIKASMFIVAASFGYTWMEVGGNFANHIPAGILREIARKFFEVGTLIGLSIDAQWLMNQVSKDFKKEVPSVTNVYGSDHSSHKRKVIEIGIPIGFGVLSTAPWFYASYISNSGLKQILIPPIVFLNNLAFGYFGYSLAIKKLRNRVNYHNLSPELKEIEDVRAILIIKVKYLINNSIEIPSNIKSAEQLLKYLLRLQIKESHNSSAQKLFQVIITLSMPLLYVVTEEFLTKQFLYKNVFSNTIASYCSATLVIFPGYTLSLLSTLENAAQLGKKNNDSIQSLLYFYMVWVRIFLTFIIALGVPSASAEIAYNVIIEELGDDLVGFISGIIGGGAMYYFHSMLFTMALRELTTELMVAIKSTPLSEVINETETKVEEIVESDNNIPEPERIATQHKKLNHFVGTLSDADAKNLIPAVLFYKANEPSSMPTVIIESQQNQTIELTRQQI